MSRADEEEKAFLQEIAADAAEAENAENAERALVERGEGNA